MDALVRVVKLGNGGCCGNDCGENCSISVLVTGDGGNC